MPKMKTHSGAKKRFKLTKNKKLRGHHTSPHHEQVRRSKKEPYKELSTGQAKRVQQLLGTYNKD